MFDTEDTENNRYNHFSWWASPLQRYPLAYHNKCQTYFGYFYQIIIQVNLKHSKTHIHTLMASLNCNIIKDGIRLITATDLIQVGCVNKHGWPQAFDYYYNIEQVFPLVTFTDSALYTITSVFK